MSPCEELVDQPMPIRLAWWLPMVRFTLGRIMVAVAIVAMVLGLAMTAQRRRVRYERLADDHQRQACAGFVEAHEGIRGCILRKPPHFARREDREQEEVEWLTKAYGTKAGLAAKRAFEHEHRSEACARAARRAWIDLVLRSPEP
jgi:hypothetical protein